MEIEVDGRVVEIKTLGEARGLTKEREGEISKLVGNMISKIKNSGKFNKNQLITELSSNKELNEAEHDLAIFLAGFYSALIETPRVIFVHNIKKQNLSSDENQGYS